MIRRFIKVESGATVGPSFVADVRWVKGRTDEQLAELGYYLCVYEVEPELMNIMINRYAEDPVVDDVNKTVYWECIGLTPEERLDVLNEKKRQQVDFLWNSAHNFEMQFISGSAVGMLTALVLSGNAKGLAVQLWIKSLWELYYLRKNEILDSETLILANGVFDDICGVMPHTIPELMVEYELLINP